MNARSHSMYHAMVAAGDDADAPERIHVDLRGDRAVVTLDESDRLNVLSAPLVRQLRRALQALDADADIRSVVLTGADPGFSAGGDLKMMQVAVDQLGAPEGAADVWRWIRREFGGIARLIAGSEVRRCRSQLKPCRPIAHSSDGGAISNGERPSQITTLPAKAKRPP